LLRELLVDPAVVRDRGTCVRLRATEAARFGGEIKGEIRARFGGRDRSSQAGEGTGEGEGEGEGVEAREGGRGRERGREGERETEGERRYLAEGPASLP
jgi:hypothetical protein